MSQSDTQESAIDPIQQKYIDALTDENGKPRTEGLPLEMWEGITEAIAGDARFLEAINNAYNGNMEPLADLVKKAIHGVTDTYAEVGEDEDLDG